MLRKLQHVGAAPDAADDQSAALGLAEGLADRPDRYSKLPRERTMGRQALARRQPAALDVALQGCDDAEIDRAFFRRVTFPHRGIMDYYNFDCLRGLSCTMKHSIAASRVMTRPGAEPTRGGGRIEIAGGVIAGVTDAAPPASPDLLAMPAFGNAHDHGRGAKFLAHGLKDAPLEAWVPAFYARPDVDPYLNSLLIMGHFAQSGIAAAIHCHQTPKRAENFESEIVAAARAADTIGIRLGLVVPMRDRNRLCYGSDDELLAMLAPDDRDEVAANWLYTPLPPKEQVARIEHLAKVCDSALVQVQFGPVGVQWASDELLASIAEASARSGRRVHMHLLELKYQREWLDATYRGSPIGFLDEIGLLSPRLSVAHGVWLRPDEMELMAERGVIVSLNTSSNLRLGSRHRASAGDDCARRVGRARPRRPRAR